MPKKMPGVMLYFELRPAAALLSFEEKGRLLDAILDYGDTGLKPELETDMLRMVWAFLAPRLDADRERYNAKCEKARENAAKRWTAEPCEGIQSYAPDANVNSNVNPTPTPSPTATTATAARGRALAVEKPVQNPETVENTFTTCVRTVENSGFGLSREQSGFSPASRR